MALYYLSGDDFNLVVRGPEALTSVGTVNSLFPLTNLGSGRPAEPFSFSQAIASMRIICDTQLLGNGGFETSTLDGWTEEQGGAGVTAEETTTINSGVNALRCNRGGTAGADIAARYRDTTMRSGERFRARGYLRGDGTNNAEVELYCVETDEYWTGSAWSGTQTSALTRATATYAQVTTDVTMPTYGDTGLYTLTLRWRCKSVASGDVFFDDLEIIPAVNFCGVFSHNFTPAAPPNWRSDDDSAFGSPTANATLTIRHPNTFSYLSVAVYERHHDILLNGTATANPRAGEWVLGYAETLARHQNPAWKEPRQKPQSRNVSPEGHQYVAARGPHPLRRLELPIKHFIDSERDELLNEVLGRSGYGEHPVVLVPDSTRSGVIFGRATETFDLGWRNNISDSTVVIEEDGHMDWIDG